MKFFDFFRKNNSSADPNINAGSPQEPIARPETSAAAILELSTDEVLRHTAKILASPPRWHIVAREAEVFWGTYTRDKKPLHCSAAINKKHFYCTCGAKTQPCKHTLGLAMLVINHPTVVLERNLPDELTQASLP